MLLFLYLSLWGDSLEAVLKIRGGHFKVQIGQSDGPKPLCPLDTNIPPMGGIFVSIGGEFVSIGGVCVSIGGVFVSMGYIFVSMGGVFVSSGGIFVLGWCPVCVHEELF